ncbi:hypothetical protein NW757_000747 [Fusarium falciforme]|nr:hypothetical protein NW757_000747 [Fusarium falciforme]
MASRDNLAADLFPPEIDKLMATDYPTSPLFAASSKGRPVRWTSKTVTSSNSIDAGNHGYRDRPFLTRTAISTATNEANHPNHNDGSRDNSKKHV